MSGEKRGKLPRSVIISAVISCVPIQRLHPSKVSKAMPSKAAKVRPSVVKGIVHFEINV